MILVFFLNLHQIKNANEQTESILLRISGDQITKFIEVVWGALQGLCSECATPRTSHSLAEVTSLWSPGQGLYRSVSCRPYRAPPTHLPLHPGNRSACLEGSFGLDFAFTSSFPSPISSPSQRFMRKFSKDLLLRNLTDKIGIFIPALKGITPFQEFS